MLKSILDVTAKEAKKFFLKESNYSDVDLPEYIHFNQIIKQSQNILTTSKNKTRSIDDLMDKKTNLGDYNINYTIKLNKDGNYSWRPITFINPIAYVDLVNFIIDNWNKIIKRFKYKFPSIIDINYFDESPNKIDDIHNHIVCASIPVYTKDNNQEQETISKWWQDVEQGSIKASLLYDYCMKTDITNCYGSMYTHSIAWALMGRDNAKRNITDKNLFGNQLDKKISKLQNNQTNGIPQSGELFNFIAEMILGYIDRLLYKRISEKYKIKEYKIIRYRDDYRIFSNSKNNIQSITKALSDVLAEFNMSLNQGKTKLIKDNIIESIKPDKIYWMTKEKDVLKLKSLYKQLIQIKILANKYPNSGSLKTILFKLYQKLKNKPKQYISTHVDLKVNISIIVSLLIKNPKSIVPCIFILSKLISFLKDKDKVIIIEDIINKIKGLPNTEFMQIWLQRIIVTVKIDNNNQEILKRFDHECKICDKVSRTKNMNGKFTDIVNRLWNVDWLKSKYKNKFIEDIIDKKSLNTVTLVIKSKNINKSNSFY